MGHDEAARLLQQNLDEEKTTDEKLTSLAIGGINDQAAAGAHQEEVGGSEAAVSGRRRGSKESSRR
jgi:hypothetical protein